MSDVHEYINAIKSALNDGPTPGEWHPGHFGEECKCQCREIVCESIAGGIATVLVNNGKPVGEGGNDCPDAKEAAANMRFIAACNPSAISAILAEIDRLKEDREEHTKAAVGKALRMGFELGFMATSEGFNGEYPFDGCDFETSSRLVKLREEKLKEAE